MRERERGKKVGDGGEEGKVWVRSGEIIVKMDEKNKTTSPAPPPRQLLVQRPESEQEIFRKRNIKEGFSEEIKNLWVVDRKGREEGDRGVEGGEG